MIGSSDLLYFIETAQTLHMSRAAQRLGISQPALSHCIRRIEDQVGHYLFRRTKKGLELTSAGQRFHEQSKILQDQWNRVMDSVDEDVESVSGSLRLGCHSAVAQYSLPAFLPKTLKQYPKLKIQLHHGLSRHMTEKVVGGELDLAIVINPVLHPDLVIKELGRDEVSVWKSKDCLNPDLLIQDPQLIQTQEVLRKLKKAGLHFQKTIESSSLEVICQLMVAGTGCAILPERVVKAFSGAKKMERLKNAPSYSDRICLVYRPELRQTRRGQALIDKITEHLTF